MTELTAEFALLDDKDAFHLPMPGLFADLDIGSGTVAMTDEFLDAPANLRVRMIQQWLRGLNHERDSALVEMFREFAAPLRGLSIVEQVDRFRQRCGRQGLECPSEFPVLLQRF